MPFKRLGLAITFSPTGKALLREAKRLVELFGAEIILIHIGERNKEDEKRLNQLVEETGFSRNSTKIEWETGDVVQAIIKKIQENKIDLLIAGALEKENIFRYYIGSVARRLMREAPCSTLIITEPSEIPKGYKNFSVSVEYSSIGEMTLRIAYDFALLEQAEVLTLIKEFQIPGLAMTIHDTGSMREVEKIRKNWENEEKVKIEMLAKELKLNKIPLNVVCLYGKEGYEANNYVARIDSDIYCISSPQKRLKFVDRLFQHDIEFTLKQLPCPVLIIRKTN